jgi:hypothetical protein
MADIAGQAEIRGIDIDKLATGFAEEAIILKSFCNVSNTSSREIRWYTKTSGILDSTDTTGVTTSRIANSSSKALPVIVNQSWTRTTSYVKKYMVESELISDADIKDSDPDIWGDTIRDLTRSVQNQVDVRILAVLGDTLGTGGNVNTAAATADGWNDVATGNPITDINNGIQQIRANSYEVGNLVMYMNQAEEKHLKDYLISVKGSSIPGFASEQVGKTRLMSILGVRILVSANMSTDTVIMFIPNFSCKWKQFTPLKSAVIDFPLIGKKIRIAEEGEALLVHPKSVHVITDTIV